MLALALSGLAGPVAIALSTAAGILMALLAWARFPSDKTSAAVEQSQGANEIMARALDAEVEQRRYWQHRYDDLHARFVDMAAELHQTEADLHQARVELADSQREKG